MKRLSSILIALVLLSAIGCSPVAPIDPPYNPPPTTPPEVDPPAEPPTGSDVVLAYITPGADTILGTDDDELHFHDGATLTHAYTGKITSADPRVFSVDDVLHYFDAAGAVSSSHWLPVAPDLTEVTPSGMSAARAATMPVDDVYALEIIPPDEAYALGALYRNYTRIFENSIEVNGPWYLNEWNPVKAVEAASGDIFALDDMSVYHPLNNSLDAWRVIDGGLIFHNYDQVNNTVYIKDETGDYFTPFLRNYFIGATWLKSGDTWYSHNGYSWTGAGGLDESGNAMWTWTEEPYPVEFNYVYGEPPLFIPGGVRLENSEDVLYWIECNRGDLWRYIPSTDNLSYYASIYAGDGMRLSGVADSATLEPVMVGDTLYFTRDDTIYQIDMTSLLVTVFGPKGTVIPW